MPASLSTALRITAENQERLFIAVRVVVCAWRVSRVVKWKGPAAGLNATNGKCCCVTSGDDSGRVRGSKLTAGTIQSGEEERKERQKGRERHFISLWVINSCQ